MKKLLLFILLVGQVAVVRAQGQVYTSLETALQHPEKVKQLRLAHYHFTPFPQSIVQFKNLEKLTLIYCTVTALPKEIGQLKKLKVLSLPYNELKKLPREIGQLTALQKLDLYGNHLTKLPASVGKLKYLRYINLGKNSLKVFPKMLFQIPNLQHIDLYKNQLNTLPPSIRRWARKRTLLVHKNPLKQANAQVIKHLNQSIYVPYPPPPPPPVRSQRELGKINAQKDFNQGIIRFVFYGYPDNHERQKAYVNAFKKIGVPVQDKNNISEAWMEGYNAFMHRKLQAKLGKNYWVRPNIEADLAVNYHVPRLPGINIFTDSDVIDFTDYFRPRLKKLVKARFQGKQVRFEITVDDRLQTQKVVITQGVSNKINQECIRLLKNAKWVKPYGTTYLKHHKQVVFKGVTTLFHQK